MKRNGILVKNEIEANQFAAKVMLFTEIFVVLFFFLDVIGLLIVPSKPWHWPWAYLLLCS